MSKYPKGFRPLTQAEKKKSREKRYKAKLKILEKFGIYQPKSRELTRYRITQINKLASEYADVVTRPDQYIAARFNKLSKTQIRDVKRHADELNMRTAKDAVIVSREGYKNARVTYDKRHKEFGIIRTGKVKAGVNKGKRYKNYMSLAGLDGLEDVRNRLKRQAKKLGKLKEGQYLVFRVIQDGEIYGHSHSVYENVDLLIKHLERYHQGNIGQNISFMRMIEIDMQEPIEWKKERDYYETLHVGKRARANRRNRAMLRNGRNR